ncbi:Protein gts1 [Marasmius tenuissimus]|nr:Protein gts1 [Marasmius tenuissimus]
MSTNKITAERNQKILAGLAVKPGNDICADCKARNPRWASHNLGIFICVTCATIHRKIGTHVTKVKSITMDTWSKEQVDRMVEMGNVKSNAIYCPNEVRHPPPMQLMEQERDSELEQYIRSKYEYKRFIEKPKPESTSRSQSTPLDNAPKPSSSSLSSSGVAARPSTAAIPSASAVTPARSFSQPMPSSIPSSQPRNVSQPLNQYQHPVRQQSLAPTSALAKPPEAPKGGVWDDLVSLQTPSTNSSLPLQYSQQTAGSFSGISSTPMLSPPMGMNSTNQFNTMGGFSGGGMMTNPTGMPMSMSMGNMNTGVGMMSSNPFPQSSQFQASNSFGSQQSFGNMGFSGMQQQQQQTLFPNQPQVQSPQPTFAAQAGGGAPGQVWGVPGHSPQPMMSTTPNPMMSTTPQLPGQLMSPSPHLQTQSPSQFGGMGAGMNMGMQQGVGGMTTGMGGMGNTGFQQQSQMFAGGNPGAGWAQPQGGFGQTQQQWGTM